MDGRSEYIEHDVNKVIAYRIALRMSQKLGLQAVPQWFQGTSKVPAESTYGDHVIAGQTDALYVSDGPD